MNTPTLRHSQSTPECLCNISFESGNAGVASPKHVPCDETVAASWILCIDDDEEFCHGISLSLRSRGYEVIRAKEGINGFRYAFEFAPSAILLDLNLPNKTGRQR